MVQVALYMRTRLWPDMVLNYHLKPFLGDGTVENMFCTNDTNSRETFEKKKIKTKPIKNYCKYLTAPNDL